MKIIGLELTDCLIRMAVLEESWTGKLTLLSCEEVSIESAERRETHFKKVIDQSDQIVVSIPGHLISSRAISLPFTQPKKIDQVIPYEVESLFPFELEKMILDYHIVSQQEGSSRILAAALLKSDFKLYMEKLHRLGIDPHLVEWDGMALFNFSQAMPISGDTPLLLINMGNDHSSVCIVKKNMPLLIRNITGGAGDFKNKESWEEDHFFVKELLKTIQVFKNETGEVVQRIAVCGEGSRIDGWEEWLSRQMGKQTIEWRIADGLLKGLPSLQSVKKTPETKTLPVDPLFVPAIGLALKACSMKEGLSQINFRREEFAHTDVEKGKKGKQRTLAISIVLVLIVGLLDIGIRFSLKKNHYEKLSHQLQSEYQSLFPGAGPILNEIDQTRGEINHLKKKKAFLNLSELTSLEVLKEITFQIPKEVRIDVTELAITPEKISLEGETDSFDALDKIKESLGKARSFQDVNVSDAKMNAEESKVRFRLSMTRKDTF